MSFYIFATCIYLIYICLMCFKVFCGRVTLTFLPVICLLFVECIRDLFILFIFQLLCIHCCVVFHCVTVQSSLDIFLLVVGLPRWHSGKKSACQCWRHGFKPGVRKITGGGNGNPLQYSYLENSMDRGAEWAPWSHKESDTTERLSMHALLLLLAIFLKCY